MFCEKCGHELKEGDLICSNCGKAVPQSQLDKTAKEKIAVNLNSDESLKKNHLAGIRIFGIILMVVAGILDIVSIAMVGVSGLSEFKGVLIGSSVTFGIGLLLTFAFR